MPIPEICDKCGVKYVTKYDICEHLFHRQHPQNGCVNSGYLFIFRGSLEALVGEEAGNGS